MPYVRTVRTASGAIAVQIVHSSHRGSRDIEHIGSAHDAVELELLKAVARQRLAAGQGELALGLDTAAAGGPLPITGSRTPPQRPPRRSWRFAPCRFDGLAARRHRSWAGGNRSTVQPLSPALDLARTCPTPPAHG
jgi:hypothetical protein